MAVVAAVWLTVRAARAAPRVEPMRTRVHVASVAPGPVQALLASSAAGGAPVLAYRLEGSARQVLVEWMGERGVPAAEAREAAASGRVRLHPVLVHLLEEDDFEAWARHEARMRWRGPGFLFPPWYRIVSATGSREARCVRYLDLMTQKLEETVRSR